MDSTTEEHGFARRKTDAAPAEHAPSPVDHTPIDDGTPEDGLETDASDADQTGPHFFTRRARPVAPQRADTRPIPIVGAVERYEVPAEADVFDVDAAPPRRRRGDLPYTP